MNHKRSLENPINIPSYKLAAASPATGQIRGCSGKVSDLGAKKICQFGEEMAK